MNSMGSTMKLGGVSLLSRWSMLYIFLTLVITSLAFQNCGKGFSAKDSLNYHTFCKAQAPSQSPFANGKLQLSSAQQSGFSKASSEPIQLAVLVDLKCVGDRELSLLGVPLDLAVAHPDLSTSAIPITLPKDSDMNQLSQEAEAEICIRGIAENSPIKKSSVASINDPLKSQQLHLLNLGYDEANPLRNGPLWGY